MSLSLEDVKRLAACARVGLDLGDAENYLEKFTSDQEADALRKELISILHLLDGVRAADTGGVEPLFYPQDLVPKNRLEAAAQAKQAERLPGWEATQGLEPKRVEYGP